MRAMILAAGYGKRLAPLTDTMPKALVPISDRPLLEILLRRLEAQGFSQIAVNLHYRAEQVREFLDSYRRSTKVDLFLSFEPELLDTGGGIKKMLDFFPGEEPILVHNVDVLSDCRLKEVMEQFHKLSDCDALLVVLDRQTDRPLCFDCNMHLRGRGDHEPQTTCRHYAFSGIQVIKPSLFREHSETKFYSIDLYIKATCSGKLVKGTMLPGTFWRDLGKPADLAAVEQDIKMIETFF